MTDKNSTLTQARLKELLHYDPDTGVFTRKKTINNRAKKGAIVGTVNARGYLVVGIDYNDYYLHRLAWLYVHDYMPEEIDHDNGFKDQNWINNLKPVTHSENLKNIRIPSDNTSGVVGVGWHKAGKKWRAHINNNGKEVHLGLFEYKDDAIKVRKDAEKKYDYHKNHGDRAVS